MTKKCEEAQLVLLEDSAETHLALKRRWAEQHAAHCASCTAILSRTKGWLEAMERWNPMVSDEVLARHANAIGEFEEHPKAHWFPSFPVQAFALVSSIAIVVFIGWSDPQVPNAEERAAPPRVAEATYEVRVEKALSKNSLAIFALETALTSRETPNGVEVELAHGVAAFSLRKNSGEKLYIQTPHGRVEVVGTRFSVTTTEQTFRVSVAQGRVDVVTDERKVTLGPGEVFTRGEPSPDLTRTADAMMDAPFLSQAPASDPSVTTRPKPKRAKPEVRDDTSLLEMIETAQTLSQGGDHAVATKLLKEVEASATTQQRVFRDIARFERGKLLLERDGPRGLSLLWRVASTGSGEARRQARALWCRRVSKCPERTCSDLNDEANGRGLRLWKRNIEHDQCTQTVADQD